MRYYNELKCKNMVLNQTYVTPIFGLRCIQVVHRDINYCNGMNGMCHVVSHVVSHLVNHLEFGVVFNSSQVTGTDAYYRDVIEIE